ncbi:MAG: glucosamine-6-phosphate deaminase [Pirellulaceae bacterium]|jgi:glucosamine-6-phosphate deaminase|nr:glucosamine-6-phosphate deaminase [Pirellulaceae bacterium]MDP7018464.1 glucosamine-6-phosphate deaminase [Pirellulaceae bacterium]
MNTAAPCLIPGTFPHSFVFETGQDLACYAAQRVAEVIRRCNSEGRDAVLGLPTGSTPVDTYTELIHLHQDEGLDFSRVVTFNLDEYFGLAGTKVQSYRYWMRANFFDHVNVPESNINIPDGLTPADQVEEHCREYEAKIAQLGGLDICLLGIGRNGHVGFNEPFSIRDSRTRLCTLDPVTRRAAASDFFGEDNVPRRAITMGLGTILEAKQILLLALGAHKSAIIRETTEGPVTDRVPASFLQEHSEAAVLVDSAAAQDLTGYSTPWLLGNVEWNDYLIKRAVLWLSAETGKALLKLDENDFRQHNLHQLLRHHGPAPELAHRVFRWMISTIEYHPAGNDEQKRVICFSPHPDDDVISMGGTLIRLVDDQHEVHIAYMTSGNIAVFDHDARRVADLVTEYNRLFNIDQQRSHEVEQSVSTDLSKEPAADADQEAANIDAILKIKGLIRWSEAKAGAVAVGCDEQNLHFLDLPFYRTGTVAKRPIGPEDVKIIRDLIGKLQPHQIYVAGDLSDPHGTHRVCADAIFRAVDEIRESGSEIPEVLLYRGAWQEYETHEIEIAVPLSPNDLERKRKAIFMHESQKDEARFPGSDPREFWERAEDRNRGTADRFNQIGLPEYFGLEAFVRWNGEML